MQIVPSVLTSDLDELANRLKLAESMADCAQVDFIAGEFIPGYRTVKPGDLDGLKSNMTLIAHILAYQPESLLADIKRAGFERVIFHLEATRQPQAVIKESRRIGLEVGCAINPATELSLVLGLVDAIDELMFLAVRPRAPGRFVPSVLQKIELWKRARLSPLVSIDGGLGPDNIKQCALAGAGRAYVGAAIFDQGDPIENFENLRNMVENVVL